MRDRWVRRGFRLRSWLIEGDVAQQGEERSVDVEVRLADLALHQEAGLSQLVEIFRRGDAGDGEIEFDELDLRVGMAEEIVQQFLAVDRLPKFISE
jgi:hypothetical protein